MGINGYVTTELNNYQILYVCIIQKNIFVENIKIEILFELFEMNNGRFKKRLLSFCLSVYGQNIADSGDAIIQKN